MRKKITALIALAAMVMTLIPSVAFAQGEKVELTTAAGTKTYTTVEEAMKNVKNDPATIKLLDNYVGNGVKVQSGQNVTFDLNGKTWDVTGTVGSTGTETNGFQLLKDSTVVFKNGTVTSNTAKLLFQNYANLTIENLEATLTTPGEGHYVASNNNGKTLIKKSTIIAPKDGFALDSYSFSGYEGGDVVVDEESVLKGNVEVVNGGKLAVKGTVEGDIHVYNNDIEVHKDRTPELTVTGGVVDGAITVENNGKATVTDGFVVEMAVEGDKASATMLSGLIEKVGKGVVVNNTDIALLEAVDGSEVTAVGADYIKLAIDIAAEEDALAKVKFLRVADDSKYDIPAGVVVVNGTEDDVVVNGDTVAKGETITVKEPETPAPNPGDKPETKPETKPEAKPDTNKKPAPQTGDANSMIPLVVMIMAAGAMAVVYRKKNN